MNNYLHYQENVLLWSIMHKGTSITHRSSKSKIQPNKRWGGQIRLMCANMCTPRKTRRWPLCIFYGVSNIARINSPISLKPQQNKSLLQLLKKTGIFCCPEQPLRRVLLIKQYDVKTRTRHTFIQEKHFLEPCQNS